VYLAHRRAVRYPEPERFVPERFLHGDFGPNEFLPFGGGLRRCLGMGFAVYEMKLVLAEIVATFDFQSAHRTDPRPVRKTVVVAPSEGGRMRVMRLRGRPANEVIR
jgi:cytochrome P450